MHMKYTQKAPENVLLHSFVTHDMEYMPQNAGRMIHET